MDKKTAVIVIAGSIILLGILGYLAVENLKTTADDSTAKVSNLNALAGTVNSALKSFGLTGAA